MSAFDVLSGVELGVSIGFGVGCDTGVGGNVAGGVEGDAIGVGNVDGSGFVCVLCLPQLLNNSVEIIISVTKIIGFNFIKNPPCIFERYYLVIRTHITIHFSNIYMIVFIIIVP